MTVSLQDRRAWLTVTPNVRSVRGQRSAEQLLAVLSQYEVATNPRYAPRDGQTFCNIAACDVAKAMGVPLPYWHHPDTGEPMRMGAQGAVEMSVNRMCAWLPLHGPRFGWEACSAEGSWGAANRGEFALAVWPSPNRHGHGHVAIARPSKTGPRFWQAGKRCFADGGLEDSFPGIASKVKFFRHD